MLIEGLKAKASVGLQSARHSELKATGELAAELSVPTEPSAEPLVESASEASIEAESSEEWEVEESVAKATSEGSAIVKRDSLSCDSSWAGG
jgi:hypothetical protein